MIRLFADYSIQRKIQYLYLRAKVYVAEWCYQKKFSNGSLLDYYFNKYSQAGQDGNLREIFRRLRISNGVFIEVGAWDGEYLSNTRSLVENGWTGVFIEGDLEKFRVLREKYQSKSIIKINEYVGYVCSVDGVKRGENLRDILVDYVNEDYIENIDFVGIDVHGADLEIALTLGFRPKVMAIEGGSNFSPVINKKFDKHASNFQHPLSYIVHKLKEIDYTVVCFHQDVYALRNDLVDSEFANFACKTPYEFFEDSFLFLDRKDRIHQLFRRALEPELQHFEKMVLGNFHIHPLKKHLRV